MAYFYYKSKRMFIISHEKKISNHAKPNYYEFLKIKSYIFLMLIY
jgi:hypothetical protein